MGRGCPYTYIFLLKFTLARSIKGIFKLSSYSKERSNISLLRGTKFFTLRSDIQKKEPRFLIPLINAYERLSSTTCHSKLAVNNKRNISDGGLPEMAKQNKRDPAMLEMQIMSTWTRQSRCARNPRRTNRCRSPTDVSGYAHLCD